MVKDRRWQIYPVVDIDIKILGVPPLGLGMPFLDNDTCAKGGGYLFLLGFSSLYAAIHGWMMGWMDGWMDGWMEKSSRKRRLLLYVIYPTMIVGPKKTANIKIYIQIPLINTYKDDEESPFDTCLEKGIFAYIPWKRIGK
jgi:hypothetical protein